jgi:hypothetical protein
MLDRSGLLMLAVLRDVMRLPPSARPVAVVTSRGLRLRPVTTATPPAQRPRPSDAHERSMLASDRLGRECARLVAEAMDVRR